MAVRNKVVVNTVRFCEKIVVSKQLRSEWGLWVMLQTVLPVGRTGPAALLFI